MKIHKGINKCISIVLCLIMALATGCTGEGNTITYVNLDEHMGIQNVGEYKGVAVIANGDKAGNGFVLDGAYYLPYEVVRENIDGRYYWDEGAQLLTYASSKHIYDAYAGGTEYTKDGEAQAHTRDIVVVVDNVPYIDKDYVLQMNSAMNVVTYDSPNRIIITTVDQMIQREVSKDTRLNADLSNTGRVVKDISAGTKVMVVESGEGWAKVITEDGLTGYMDAGYLHNEAVVHIDKPTSWLETEPYTYISMDKTVCLGWHQMEYAGGNDSLNKVTSKATPLNVISPTWFKVKDGYGGISSLASKSYVDKAHKKGLQVWGLISDFNYDENKNYYINQVVKNTVSRRTLISNIMKEAEACGMDGINIDFEMIRLASAEGYVQFVRELAIECEKKGLVLSVDMYVPSGSNGYYDRQAIGEVADYLVIMGYDEHWAGCGEAGSVASLPFVKKGIEDTLKEVPASRVINAVPFYCRVWYEDTLDNAPDGATIVKDPINGDYALSSKAVGMGDAKELIEDNNGSLRWLEDLGQYYTEYYKGDRLARIWLEDKESLKQKLNVMKEHGIAGVAGWKLGLDSSEAWDAIKEYMQ
ncbi:MAG: SH3 domain-containing protein [Lachnospiraceae bacterium]|nr:SH3 domain-containing protein [Lachnospiraceae bacterium]